MAYIILDNGQFYRTAKTEADKNDVNVSPSSKSIISVSDADHLAYITNQKRIIISDNNATFENLESELIKEDEASLKQHFEKITEKANLYIKNNSSKQLATGLQSYIDYLATVDTASLSYPINWEKYCSDNSIAFYHENQIG